MYLNNPDIRGLDDGEIEYDEHMIEELKKCKKDPIYFILNYIKVIDGDIGLIPFQPRDYSLEFIKTIHENPYSLFLSARQMGKTLSVACYLCWYSIFNKNKNIMVLAHQKSMAVEILTRIKGMIQELPLWIQQPAIKWNEGSIGFKNGSRITCSATQTKSVRGNTVNLLYLDEFAFVEPHIANEFIASVFPTISSMETAKVIISSTPRGLNFFHQMWVDAETKRKSGTAGKKDFKTMKVTWEKHPKRDEEWKRNEISKIGKIRFSQEYDCLFLGSVSTLVDSKYLESVNCIEPISLLDGDRLRIYEYPIPDGELKERGFEYLITVDPAMGTMQDYSVCQVWLIESNTKIKQVAVYESNDVAPKKYVEKVYTLAKLYGDAGIIVETMEQAGGVIINDLHYEKNYPNLIHMNDKGLGFNMAHNRKIEACVYLQVYMEKGLIEIPDKRTIDQMSMFGKKGNSYKALADGHDDLITPILSMLFYVNSPYFYGNIDDEPIYKKKTVAEEFSGIEDVTDEGVKKIVEGWNEKQDSLYEIPLIKSPSNFTPYSQNRVFSDSYGNSIPSYTYES